MNNEVYCRSCDWEGFEVELSLVPDSEIGNACPSCGSDDLESRI